MDNSERREARRFTMDLPLSILPWERSGDELSVHTRDVSYRGLYFYVGEEFEAGRDIDFVITLPKDLMKTSDVKIRCRGKVIRVDPGADGKMGVAAKIERYEFMPNAAAA
jgi:hypothetical protein